MTKTLEEYILPTNEEENIIQIKHTINTYIKKYNQCRNKETKKEIMEIIQKHEERILNLK